MYIRQREPAKIVSKEWKLTIVFLRGLNVVSPDEEGCAVMKELGRNMAWLLQCIEAGKAAGISHPENPRRPMTNFIR